MAKARIPRKQSQKVKPPKSDLDCSVNLGKSMDALVTARTSLLRARAELVDFKTPDAAHTYLDLASHLIELAQNTCRQGLQVAIMHWMKTGRKQERHQKVAAERLSAKAGGE